MKNYVNKLALLILALLFLYALILPLLQQDSYRKKADDLSQKTSPELPDTEQPLHDVDLPNFAQIKDIKAKKMAFFSFLKPAVEKENQKVLVQRQFLQTLQVKAEYSDEDLVKIEALSKRYKIKQALSVKDKLTALINRVDIIPTPLVLVQAANESAWGTSRFARIGLNFFGVWCYKKGCGMVPNSRTEGLKHEVAAFYSVEDAIAHYIKNINTNAAYKVFRKIRSDMRKNDEPLSSEILATGLLPYSERGVDYVLEISEMLRHNDKFIEKSAD